MRLTESDVDALPWEEVSSSNVRRIAWVRLDDALEIGTLYVEFGKGTIGAYRDVPAEGIVKLREAEADERGSVGSTLHRHIIKANFAYERVEVEPNEEETDGDGH